MKVFPVGSSARPSFRSHLHALLPGSVWRTPGELEGARRRRSFAIGGGCYHAHAGQVVAGVDADAPFIVRLYFADGSMTEHPCETERDGKLFIRRCVMVAGRSAGRDRG